MNLARSPLFLGLFRIIVVVLVLCAPIGAVHATVFFSTDWDTGTAPSGWPCNNAPNSVCSETDQFFGWTSPLGYYCNDNVAKSSWATCGVTTTYAFSGTKSFRMHRGTSISDTCDIQHKLSSPYPTTIYVRFYLYLPASMAAYNTPVSQEPFTHFMFTNSALSGTGFRINLLSKVPYTTTWQCASGHGGVGASTPYMWFNCENNSTQCTVGAPTGCYNLIDPANLNRWQCVEFKLDAANKKMSIWVDGKLKVDNVTVPMSQSNFTMIQFSGFESQLPGAYTMDYYIDDIVVSDAYVGPRNRLAAPDVVNCAVTPNDPRCPK